MSAPPYTVPVALPTLEANLRRVRAAVERACVSAGREPGAVELLAVTKSVDAERAVELARLGQRELGESRCERLVEKSERFAREGERARWHFIGHLQRNKARRVVRAADVIHSVDTLRLIETLERVAREEGRRPRVYLEVELSGEQGRHGFAPAAVEDAARAAGAAPHLELSGLMTMAPRPLPGVDSAPAARACFEELARIARALEADPGSRSVFCDGRARLSMGMSGDFEQAIAAGSDCVRIGSALFESCPQSSSEAER